jgi:hypothetical protein
MDPDRVRPVPPGLAACPASSTAAPTVPAHGMASAALLVQHARHHPRQARAGGRGGARRARHPSPAGVVSARSCARPGGRPSSGPRSTTSPASPRSAWRRSTAYYMGAARSARARSNACSRWSDARLPIRRPRGAAARVVTTSKRAPPSNGMKRERKPCRGSRRTGRRRRRSDGRQGRRAGRDPRTRTRRVRVESWRSAERRVLARQRPGPIESASKRSCDPLAGSPGPAAGRPPRRPRLAPRVQSRSGTMPGRGHATTDTAPPTA